MILQPCEGSFSACWPLSSSVMKRDINSNVTNEKRELGRSNPGSFLSTPQPTKQLLVPYRKQKPFSLWWKFCISNPSPNVDTLTLQTMSPDILRLGIFRHVFPQNIMGKHAQLDMVNLLAAIWKSKVICLVCLSTWLCCFSWEARYGEKKCVSVPGNPFSWINNWLVWLPGTTKCHVS